MRNLLSLIGLAVVGFAGLGWYLGWYTFQSTPTSTGHRQINVDVNTKKIAADVKRGEEKLENAVHGNGTTTAPNQQEVHPTQAQPTSTQGSGLSVNKDGSVTFTLPALAPTENQQ